LDFTLTIRFCDQPWNEIQWPVFTQMSALHIISAVTKEEQKWKAVIHFGEELQYFPYVLFQIFAYPIDTDVHLLLI